MKNRKGLMNDLRPNKKVILALGLVLGLFPLPDLWVNASVNDSQIVVQVQKKVKGKVTDGAGEPLIGVNVAVIGQTGGTITDIDGNYSIDVPSAAKLKFSYIGYADQEVTVGSQNVLNIVLKESTEVLDEVVVVGFGTQKKESLTGAVTVVNSKAFIEKGNMSSPLQALQGQVPGVMITRSSSAPGDESWGMSLRGSVSVNSTDPLIIIDGVAYTSTNDLRLLNSNDIESINFLKDGAAAIYGSRAAGGVVLVTTKKGKEGKTKVDYNATATLKAVGLMPEMMSLEQWADGLMATYHNDNLNHDAFYAYAQFAKAFKGHYLQNNSSNFLGFTDVADYVFDDNVDWLGSLFGNTWSTEHNLSITGGTERSSFRISLGYLYDGSTLKYGENNNQRYNFRMNNTFKLTKKLTLDSSISYNRQEQVAPTRIDAALSASLIQPGVPLAAINGKPYQWGSGESNASPLAKVTDGGENKLSVSAIGISETLNYTINSWLTANANLGYNSSQATRDVVQKAITYYNYLETEEQQTWPAQENSFYRQTTSKTDFYSFSAYLNGHKAFGKHDLSLTLGTQYEFNEYKTWGVKVKDIQEGLEIVNGSGEVTLSGAGNNESLDKYQYAILSYFGRFNYDYDGRYLLELQGRYDGSSKFLKENRWNFFWGGSLGWRLKQETFLQDADWLSDLKLRLSYAEVGNQSGIGNYDGVQLYSLQTNTGAYLAADKVSFMKTSGTMASTTRTWERIKNYNVGLDFGFLNGKLTGSMDVFLKRNNNMLIQITYPGILGDKAPSSNSGKFKNYGFDGQLNYNDKIGEVDYHVGGTISFARNKLVDNGGVTVLNSGYTSKQQGYPLNSIFGLRYGGKIQNEEQLAAYLEKYNNNNGINMPSNLRVGDNMYCDENGDGILDEKDYIYLGSDTPEISYSFNFGASYKGVDINFIFQGVANRFVYRDDGNWTKPFNARYQNSTTASIGNTWSPDNASAYYAPYSADGNINKYNYQASSLTAQDGRYLRLKNVTIGYTFPTNLLNKVKFLSGVRFYVTGADLWEKVKITDGWDPEAKRDASGTARYPFTRNITFGANLTF
ncbi:SusC/RagA family TonB-linked outer membrane protein [Bacteroides difficilis]|uniref:SusC/RagA family TonB-linked outer membrane protein n=1 Tax=Bacteroides difficilis TaxID=2763021 RepID=UPI003AAF4421